MLESLFAAEPIADAGFSDAIMKRIRRRLWLRRLALPAAVLLGAAVALEPAANLVQALAGLSAFVPEKTISLPSGWVPTFQTVVLAAMLLVTGIFGVRMLEE